MLSCGNNFKNMYGTKDCELCGEVDDESHRINVCKKWENVNWLGSEEKFDFNDVYSDKRETLNIAAGALLKIWDLENGKNCIKTH